MNKSRVRTEPKLSDFIRLDTTITPELDSGLNDLVTVSGQSKSSLVRRALAALLAESGALPPEYPDQVAPTPTRGPGLATYRKDNK